MNLFSPGDTRILLDDVGGVPHKVMRSPPPPSALLDFDDPEPGVEFDDDEDIDDDDEFFH